MEPTKNETCVHCGGELNANTSIDGEKTTMPRPNDFTICMYCGQPYYFGEQLEKIPLSQEQYRALPMRDKEILKEAWKVRVELLRIAQQQLSKYDN
jgi:uncharacterized protein with PIN domain